MQLAFLVYEGMTALDLIGPYEILAGIPDAELCFVAKRPGPVPIDSKAFTIGARFGLSDVPAPDVFVVPGGTAGTFAASQDEEILGWVRRAHETSTWSTSVCTGSLILGAAGLLAGKRATTHWAAAGMLAAHGATYTEQRVVVEGKVVTAAGVSSGIDMALWLAARIAGEDTAKAIQLAAEYDPQPPFDAGSPTKAGEAIRVLALARLSAAL